MPWTHPVDFIASDYLTAAQMNTRIVENLKFLAAPPRFAGRRYAAQPISANSTTSIELDNEEGDAYAMHAPGASIVKVPNNGLYLVAFTIRWAAGGSGIRRGQIKKNGAITLDLVEDPPGSTNASSYMYSLASGDEIESTAWHNSTGTVNVAGASLVVAWTGF